MSTAYYGERGEEAKSEGEEALLSLRAGHGHEHNNFVADELYSNTLAYPSTAYPRHSDDSSSTSARAQGSNITSPTQDLGIDHLDLPAPEAIARNEVLRETMFPDWKDDSSADALESPEEMQKKDPLGTQIWKLYSRTKTRLPNQERMENLTWRMMAMNLRRREQMEVYVLLATPRSSPPINIQPIQVSRTNMTPWTGRRRIKL
jgi:GATA-binding protein